MNGTKNVGRHKAVVTGKGNYQGTAGKDFLIYLKPTSLVKKNIYSYPESPTTSGIQIAFNKVSSKYCDGYRIEISTSPSFKSLVGHKEFGVADEYGLRGEYRYGGLGKGKIYYIRVQTYTTIGGKNVYSDPSSYLKIKSAVNTRTDKK